MYGRKEEEEAGGGEEEEGGKMKKRKISNSSIFHIRCCTSADVFSYSSDNLCRAAAELRTLVSST